ncbi:MAG: tetratricopeptide repeat protein [Desulfitobacterium hafniense]|nr:tetratricopeptide repeat protein [Desulfitobacterium hafniense]
MKKKSLSVCLVVREEEKNLFRCLEILQEVADEIIVVVAVSCDSTVDIARKFTEKVYSFPWKNNFSDVGNYFLDKATGEWVLVLGGDEELEPQSIGPLRECIEHQEMDGYFIKVLKYHEAGTEIHVASDIVLRLFQNKEGYRYSGAIHEQLKDDIKRANPDAKFGSGEDISIIHRGYLLENFKNMNKTHSDISLFEDSLNKDPDNLHARFHLGVEYLRTNQHAEALEQFLHVYDRVNIQVIYVPQLMSNIVTCRYLLGEYKLAQDFIEQVWIKCFPDHGDLYYLKGLICRALGRHMEAYKSFTHGLKLTYQPPHYANIYCQHKYNIYFQLGQLSEFFMDKEKALQLYIEALKDNPVTIEPLAKIIGILNPKENPDYTEECLNKFFDLTNHGVRVELGEIFFSEGAYPLAIKYFSPSQEEVNLSSQVLLLKGIAHFYINQYPIAIGELNKIPREDNLYINAQSRLFLYYWTRNYSYKASICVNNCRLTGANPLLLDFLCILSGELKLTSESMEGVDGNLPDVFSGLFELLIALDRPKKLEQAIDCLKGLVKTYPAKLLGDLFYKHGKFERAEAEFRGLIAREQSDAELLFSLGKTYRAMGKLVEAENFMSQAINAGDESPKTAWELARLYQEMALKTLQKGLEKHPECQEIRKLLENISDTLIEV